MSALTYSLLSLAFLAAALLVAVWALLRATGPAPRRQAATPPRRVERRRLLTRWLPAAGLGFLIVAVLTAVFDTVLIGLDIIRYDSTLISGVRVGLAPIEDFAYPLAAMLLVPSLWSLLTPTSARADEQEARESRLPVETDR